MGGTQAQLSQKDRTMLRLTEYFAKSLEVIRNGTIRKLGYRFLFAFHSNYGSILYHFRDKAICWSKITIFSYPPASVGISPYRSVQKLEWCAYPMVKKLRICLAVLTGYRRVTDRRADIQTFCDGTDRAMHIIER